VRGVPLSCSAEAGFLGCGEREERETRVTREAVLGDIVRRKVGDNLGKGDTVRKNLWLLSKKRALWLSW
jgi:hypothetical protein